MTTWCESRVAKSVSRSSTVCNLCFSPWGSIKVGLHSSYKDNKGPRICAVQCSCVNMKYKFVFNHASYHDRITLSIFEWHKIKLVNVLFGFLLFSSIFPLLATETQLSGCPMANYLGHLHSSHITLANLGLRNMWTLPYLEHLGADGYRFRLKLVSKVVEDRVDKVANVPQEWVQLK